MAQKLGNKNYIDDTLLNSLKIEISPLFADDVESFVERWTQLDKSLKYEHHFTWSNCKCKKLLKPFRTP
jgi:hypothetical protein